MAQLTLNEYIKSLNSDSVTPGGGSAVANSFNIAIALSLMAINVSKNRQSFKKLDDSEQKFVKNTIKELENIQKLSSELALEDEKAFKNYMKIAKTGSKKDKNNALKACFNAPYSLFNVMIDSSALVMALKPYIVRSITSDYKISLELLKACIKSCLFNIEINVKSLNTDKYSDLYKLTVKAAKNTINGLDKTLKKVK